MRLKRTGPALHEISSPRPGEVRPWLDSVAEAIVQPLFAESVAAPAAPSLAYDPMRSPRRSLPPAMAEAERQALDQARRSGYEAGLLAGRNAGYSEGLRQGRAEGEHETLQVVEAELASHRVLMAELEKARDELIQVYRKRTVDLGLAIAERVLRRSLAEADALAPRIEDALAAVSDGFGEPVRVRVCPGRGEPVRAMLAAGSGEGEVLVAEDPGLGPGDVVVDCAGRSAAAIVADELARLEEALRD